MTPKIFRFFLDQPLRQLLTEKKREKAKIWRIGYPENEKSFLDEILKKILLIFEGLSFAEALSSQNWLTLVPFLEYFL